MQKTNQTTNLRKFWNRPEDKCLKCCIILIIGDKYLNYYGYDTNNNLNNHDGYEIPGSLKILYYSHVRLLSLKVINHKRVGWNHQIIFLFIF